MHLQIKASPDSTAENMRKVVDALAAAGVNIEALAPDFDPPHVRVLVRHNNPYDRDDATDPFNRALDALRGVGLTPTVVRATDLVDLPNRPAALQTAMDALEGEGHELQSILVLPAGQADRALVSFGVAGDVDDGWDVEGERLKALVEDRLRLLPD
jgi:hypothetical protein